MSRINTFIKATEDDQSDFVADEKTQARNIRAFCGSVFTMKGVKQVDKMYDAVLSICRIHSSCGTCIAKKINKDSLNILNELRE